MEQLFRNALGEEDRVQEAILISVFPKGEDSSGREASLAELERLVQTAGGRVFAKLVQVKDHPDAASYLGSGKLQELSDLCKVGGVSLVVCDDDLSPVQIRNLEDEIEGEVLVIDRTMLILDIFALHASTADGKLQVELAQLKYSAPRLIGKGKALSRQGGGIGTRGPGESKLESDRRYLKTRVRALEDQLDALSGTRQVQRKQRARSGVFRFAIAGYTNAGKSTLLNALTGAGVKEKDELFATLDPTTRKLELPSGTEILLTDTVGFIRNLPHHLVKAFRSTLDEVALCDAVLLVVDVSDPEAQTQLQITTDLLRELGAGEKPTLYLLNKCDKATTLLLPFLPGEAGGAIFLSAKTGEGIDRLISEMERIAGSGSKRVLLRIPQDKMGVLSTLYEQAANVETTYTEEGAEVSATLPPRLLGKLRDLIVQPEEGRAGTKTEN